MRHRDPLALRSSVHEPWEPWELGGPQAPDTGAGQST